ncbi:calcineurin-like phosphoesterase [Achlya hypogyna]|uniref:Calcineurin-like phosphoesterase n=1 Tax=Achlya hypogyna TaxID=1202772 RepID=A0A1V9ZK88_ACHHY|nr:calcineurin-like phosphoesterase [Achlya hypogyna]
MERVALRALQRLVALPGGVIAPVPLFMGLSSAALVLLVAVGYGIAHVSSPLAFVAVGFCGLLIWRRLVRACGLHPRREAYLLAMPQQPDALRFVCVANTHGKHTFVDVPAGDVLVVAGGCTKRGRHSEAQAFNAWLVGLPHPTKLVVPGEHERSLDLTTLLPNATVLLDESITIDSINVFGASSVTQEWKDVPRATDVLVTPMPPLGVLDTIFSGHHVGHEELLKAVLGTLRPTFHVFGLAQESYGHKTLGPTTFVNAAVCTALDQPTNAPMVFDIRKKT